MLLLPNNGMTEGYSPRIAFYHDYQIEADILPLKERMLRLRCRPIGIQQVEHLLCDIGPTSRTCDCTQCTHAYAMEPL